MAEAEEIFEGNSRTREKIRTRNRAGCGRRIIYLLALLFLALELPAPLRASQQNQNPSASLTAITVTGSQAFASEAVAAASGLAVGQTVTKQEFQKAADRLSALGCFSQVHYRFSSEGDSVQIEFQVKDAPLVPVSFDDFPSLGDDEITAAIKAKVPLFDGMSPTQGSLVDEIGDALAGLLASRKIPGKINHRLTVSPLGNGDEMRFSLEGPSMTVGQIQFTDALAQQDPHVQERVTDITGKPYSRYTVQVFNEEQVRPVYLQHGFLDVKFGPAEARFTGDPNQPLPTTVLVIDPIIPGPSFVWEGAEWEGNSAISAADLNKLLGFQPGQPADGIQIEAGWDRIRAAYGKDGYIDAVVQPEENFDEAHDRAAYRVKITEGTQYHMGDLILSGLSMEGERRIRAAWEIPKGAVLNKSFVDEFIETGAMEALKGLPIHPAQIGHYVRTNPKTATADVLMDFE